MPDDRLGGAEFVLKTIVSHLVASESTVDVLFLNKEKSYGGWKDLYDCKWVNFFFINWKSPFKLYFLFYSKQYYQVFSSQTLVSGLVGILIFLKLIKTKYFICRESTSHFERFRGLKLLKYRIQYFLGYRKSNLIICQTARMQEQLLNSVPRLKSKCYVIPNPINLNSAVQNSLISIADIPKSPFIVAAGRLIKLKGFHLLIKSLKEIRKYIPEMNLLLLGEGPELSHLTALSTALGLQEEIHFMGFKENVYPYFKRASICVVSSLIEGFPNVLLQMMAVNNNVVSTLCAGGIENISGLYTTKTNCSSALSAQILNCYNTINTQNSILFKQELEQRSVGNFLSKIECVLTQN